MQRKELRCLLLDIKVNGAQATKMKEISTLRKRSIYRDTKHKR